MIYVVVKETKEIIDRCDAWFMGGLEMVRERAVMDGRTILKEEITFNGDMVIWVE